jgi:c-di-GMP-binding flagellar brake protein YcgR
MGRKKRREMKNEETEPRSGVVDFEKRGHPRTSIALPIEYWQIDKSKSCPGQTIDVSEGGLLLHLSEPTEIGQVFRLTLFVTFGPDLDSILALVQVEVVWKDTHMGKDGGYRVGVKFVDISPEDMDKLKNFLKTLEFKTPQPAKFHLLTPRQADQD